MTSIQESTSDLSLKMIKFKAKVTKLGMFQEIH